MFRHKREEQGGSSVLEKLRRKMQMRNILDNLELDYFLSTIMIWMRGKNVFIEEDCMILNFGSVVECSLPNIFYTYQVLWRLVLPTTIS